jgi:tRNA/tmRNA/rRNA uracil-C5-methylase (TrmA/RlmC/RlmD family)
MRPSSVSGNGSFALALIVAKRFSGIVGANLSKGRIKKIEKRFERNSVKPHADMNQMISRWIQDDPPRF